MSKMPLIVFLLGISSISTQVFAETDLEKAQSQIIALQNEKMELMKKLTKTYKSTGVCYMYKDNCVDKQSELNQMFGIFSNSEVSLRAYCKEEKTSDGICAGHDYLLKVDVKISP